MQSSSIYSSFILNPTKSILKGKLLLFIYNSHQYSHLFYRQLFKIFINTSKNGRMSSLSTLETYFNFICISIVGKYRYIGIIVSLKFYFSHRAGSKGSVQKSKTSRSNSNEARLCRALLKEEKKILYQERLNKYSKEYEERQAILDSTYH